MFHVPKTQTKPPTDDAQDAGAGDGAGDDGARGDGARGGDAPVTRGDVESIVESLVPRIVDELLGDDGAGDGDAGNSGDGGSGDGGGAPSSAAHVEQSVAGEVAAALQNIRTAEQVAEMRNELTSVRETIEKAPRKLSRLTRAVWGDDGAS